MANRSGGRKPCACKRCARTPMQVMLHAYSTQTPRTHTDTDTNTHTRTYTHSHTRTRTHSLTNIHTHARTHTQTHTRASTHTTHIHVHTHTRAHNAPEHPQRVVQELRAGHSATSEPISEPRHSLTERRFLSVVHFGGRIKHRRQGKDCRPVLSPGHRRPGEKGQHKRSEATVHEVSGSMRQTRTCCSAVAE
jgi:hypothetical protein